MKYARTLISIAILFGGTVNVAAEGEFSWRKDAWADALCASKNDTCRLVKNMEYWKKYEAITQDGQRWLKRSCPEFLFLEIDSCAYRQIEAMLKPGWPTLDRLEEKRKTAIEAQCPRASMSPSNWRNCVEKQLQAVNRDKGWAGVVVKPFKEAADIERYVSTAEEYARHIGSGAVVLAPGKLRLAGRIQLCGQRPTVMDPTMDGISKPFDGFIVINPVRAMVLPPVVQQWIYARGCAFQFRGPDPAIADCFATARGKRQKWLTSEGVEQVCSHVDEEAGEVSFPERCQLIRKCALLPSDEFVPDMPQSIPEAVPALQMRKPPMPTSMSDRVMAPELLYKIIAPSVYLVVGSRSVDALRKGEGVLGSAVAVAEHVAITNCHVVKDQSFLALVDDTNKNVLFAFVSAADEATDRCFITVKESLKSISTVRRAGDLNIGERVYSIGNPSGMTKTLGEGIISGLRQLDVLYVQTTAQISKGSSGGALVDSKGALVGITTMMVKDSQNLNFAIAAEDFWK